MKKELFVHFAFLISFFVLITLFKRWISLDYWTFWIGGVVGTILPDLDHLIYIYFLKPQDLTSQRVGYMVQKGEITNSLDLLASTRYERAGLVFHTAFFQLIFFILTFLVISSSGNLFGRGLVLAFTLHLVVDQFVDIMQTGGMENWSKQINILPIAGLSKEKLVIYWIGCLLLTLIFGFLL